MTEQKFLSELQKWLRANRFPTCIIEAKVARGTSIPYAALEPHQYRNLTNAQRTTITYKIPDDGYGQKPFDCVVFTRSAAYVAVLFYEKRGSRDFFLIPIRLWRFAEKTDNRKSLTKQRAHGLGIHGVLIT